MEANYPVLNACLGSVFYRIQINSVPLNRKVSGFTLVELIMVIVILGIISAISIPLFLNTQTLQGRFFFDQLKSDLTVAQRSAVSSGCQLQFTLDNSHYQIDWDSNCSSTDSESFSTPLLSPDNHDAINESIPGAVSLLLPASDVQLIFTAAGQIEDTSGTVISSQLLRFDNEGRNLDITLYGDTGFIQ